MDIEFLAEHPESIPLLVDLYETEWAPYYGADGPGDALADLTARCNRDEIPAGIVAVENGEIVGTAALDTDVATGLTPSVVGLLVRPSHRRRGVATALLQGAESLAGTLGLGHIFVSTADLGDLLVRMGWRFHDEARFHDQQSGAIYVKDL